MCTAVWKQYKSISIQSLWAHIDILIHLLTAIGLTLGGSSTADIYTQTNTEHNETEYPERNIHNNKNMYSNKRIHNIIKEYLT